MVIERNGEDNRHNKEDRKDKLIVSAEDWKANEINQQDDQLSGHDVRQNRTDEKTLLALEHRATRTACVLYFEGTLNYGRLPTSRTKKLETSQQNCTYRSFFLATFHWQVHPQRSIAYHL